MHSIISSDSSSSMSCSLGSVKISVEGQLWGFKNLLKSYTDSSALTKYR